MTGLFFTALVLGAIGSLHCIGMCGPLALALPVVAHRPLGKFAYTLLYNLGRVATYAVIGAMAGIAGAGFAFAGFQQWLSIVLGAAILIYLLWPGHRIFLSGNQTAQAFFQKLRKQLSQLLRSKNYHSVFFIGLLNGLLPCGLVYIALAASVATGTVIKSSLFMAAFGLGTLPAMWALAFFGGLAKFQLRPALKKIYPYLMFVIAGLLILRGLGLNIPYLSPGMHEGMHDLKTPVSCHGAIANP